MAFEPGGRADKLGNRYEGQWVAWQLLRLLREEIVSVTLEAIGDDEAGVDLWTELKSGVRQAQQCKARNGSEECWLVSDLKARGVLARLRHQLDRDPRTEFAFVSGLPATVLGDLCDSARNSPGAESYFGHQGRLQGASRHNAIRQFFEALDLDSQTPQGRAQAFDYLRRCRIAHHPFDDGMRQVLLAMAGLLLTGRPETIIATLCEYAESSDHWGRPIYADEVRDYLDSLGICSKNLAYDRRISPAVLRLQMEFQESIRPLLIGGLPIHRDETDRCLEALEEEPVIVLHGAAGSGKSGVLYEIARKLESTGTPYLPLRLDDHMPHGTAVQFGRAVGLPESPVQCLVALAGSRRSVLILDQLDAIRWTSSRSANALAVCREVLAQALSYRLLGMDINVILTCRTFDLENDPQIRNWLADRQRRVEVKPLPDPSVREVCGADYKAMTEKQRAILANPQNLSMWVAMQRELALPPFHSAAELMRRFWTFRRGQMEELGIDASDITGILDALRHWMEQASVFSAPERVVDQFSRQALDALKSHGVLQARNGMLRFSHQSYLDYLIAERVLAAMDRGGTILDWLGPKEKQALLRREQLRQALALLERESPTRFRRSAQAVLKAHNVRFHLKQLVLEVLGQVEDVGDDLGDFCIELARSEHWRPHALDTVFWGHTQNVRLLAERGVLSQWLNSAQEETVCQALELLRSVGGRSCDLVGEVLAPFVERDAEWAQRVLRAIGWDVAADSEATFELRLRLAKRGFIHDIVDWPALCRKHPLRALRLIDAHVSTWVAPKDAEARPDHMERLDRLTPEIVSAMSEIGRVCAQDTWDVLMPHVSRLTRFDEPLTGGIPDEWRKNGADGLPVGGIHLARALVEMAVAAGQRLAEDSPALLLERSKPYEESSSLLVQQVLVEAYSHLPPTYAGAGLEWLLQDDRRMSVGDGEAEPVWMPAARMVEALSPHCTADAFRRLEQTLIHYRDPYERSWAKHRLESWREGYFIPYWGRGQHFLLPALCPERRTRLVDDLIATLEERFKEYSIESFLRGGFSGGGGFVGSKLDQRLDRISDRSWLAIVADKRLPERHGKWEWVAGGGFLESSIWQFSRSLATIAMRFPERFGGLALQFPPDTHPAYVSAILSAMRLTQPGPAVQPDMAADWTPASPNTVMAVLERFPNLDDREPALAFCQLVRSRAEEEWPPSAIERLMFCACKYPDPEPGRLVVHCDKSSDEATVDMLFQNTINCVRGVAAGAMGRLLWHHPDLLDTLWPAIASAVNDPHPAVRMAAVEALLPVLNISREQAVDWFYDACKLDPRISASPRAIEFFNYTIRQHSQQLGCLVRSMVRSEEPDVAHLGAQAVTAYWLFYGLFEEDLMDVVGRCRVIRAGSSAVQGELMQMLCRCLLAMRIGARPRGGARQRAGVARVAASHISEAQYAAKCRALIAPFFKDPDKDVRHATHAMWTEEFLHSAESVALAKTYVRSRAFTDGPSSALRRLEQYGGSLVPLSEVVFEVCKTLTGALVKTEKDSPPLGHEVRTVLLLLLRLYDQTQERRPEIAHRCLDMWDELLEKRVATATDLTRAIDR